MTDSQSSELRELCDLVADVMVSQDEDSEAHNRAWEALRQALSEVLRQREEAGAELASTATTLSNMLADAEARVERAEQERDEAREWAKMLNDAAWEMNYEHGTKPVLPWERSSASASTTEET